jgi:hypothetical protein
MSIPKEFNFGQELDKKCRTIFSVIVLLIIISPIQMAIAAAPRDADVNGDGNISDHELLRYIDRWAQGKVEDWELLNIIDIWEHDWHFDQIGDADVALCGPIGGGVARLYFEAATMWDVCDKSLWYAGEIIRSAKDEGYKVVKPQHEMAGEICFHIALFDAGERGHSNPADLELYTGDWWAPSKGAISINNGKKSESDIIRAVLGKRLEITPKEFRLLQNYPNPFNPETWIPYSLARDGRATIKIYNPSGRLIRTLKLGHKQAGFYLNRDRAAYWEGRDNFGEKVASGVYFYTLQVGEAIPNIGAGKFTAIRKMIIVE